MQDNLKDLYNSLTADGKVDGSEQEFREIFSNAENLKQLHGALTADGEDYGTEDEFVNMFLPSSTPTQQVNEYAKTIQVPKLKATPKKQGLITRSIYGDKYKKNQQEGYKPQPNAVPSSLYAPESNNKTVLMQNMDAQQNAFNYQQQNTPLAKSLQQQKAKDKPAYTNIPASISRTVGDEQRIVNDTVKKNVDAAIAAGSKDAVADAVKKTYEELAQQGFDVNTINESGVVGEGVYNAVAPSAEAAAMQGGTDIFKGVFDEAKLKAITARDKELSDVEGYRGFGPQGKMATLGNYNEATRRYYEELEPDKVTDMLNKTVNEKGMQTVFKHVMEQSEKYGIDPTEYFKTYVAPSMKNRAAQLLDFYMQKEFAPRNDKEYILSGFSDSMVGMFTDWMTKSAKQNAYKQQALADYKASTGTEIARRAVGLISSAPEFMVSGGIASAATKKICGRAITNMVARGFTEAQARNILTAQLASKFGQRMAVSMVQGAVSGAANFGTLDAMSEAMRGVRDDDFSVKNVFDKGIQGASKGIVFGGVTGAYSAATAELTGAKKIISNLLGVPVNGLGLTASENTINLITGAETEDKPFFEQWAENSLTDLMMRATSHHNVSVLTSKGRRELGARIRSTFSGMSDSQKQLGANWRAHGFSEEAEAQLKNITGCDNLRDVLEYGVPKATDMPSLPYQGGEVKAKSQSVDDILKAEARKVREQNWDNLMNNRDLPAEVKQQLAAVMNAEYIPNPTVTQTTVTDSQGRKYVEYRDAGGNLNKRVPLADADMSMDAQEKIKNTNAISKMYSLGVSGKAVLAANAMRYASRPDAEGNIPTEEQQVQRQKNFLDRFFKKDLTDMELTELNMDLDKATIMFGGADKIKVITHTDGTASVQYSKNGIPVRTDHYATAEEANKKAYDDKFAQDMSLINALEDPEAVQKYYETQKGVQPGTLAEAVKGYDPADIDRVTEQMLQTRDRVDIVTSGDGRARTTEQEELLQQYISWLKEQQKQFEQQPNEFSLTMNAAEQPQYTENYDQQDNHQINLTENDAVADDGKTKQTFATDAEKYKLNEADPQQMQGTETAMPTEQTPQTKPVGAIEAESQRTQSEGTTEVEQPTPIPANIDANTPHGSAYINGKNAVDGNNLPVMYQLNEDYELAKHRMAKFVPSNCPILDDILTMCQTRRFAEAQDLIAATDIPVDQKDALSKFLIAEATQSGMQDAMSDKIKAQQEQAAVSIQAKADEQGNVTIVTLDNSSKKAHIVKGDVNNLNGTVMIRELDANENPVGDPYQISVKKIKSVSDTQRASEMAFNERKRIQQELDAYYAQALNDVSFQPGKKVALKFEGMTIEATVVSENTDGTVTFQTEDGETITSRRDEAMQMLSDAKQEGYAIALQYEADAYAKARKEAEEARKQAEEAEAKRIAAEQAAAAERERLKDPVNRLKRDEAGKLDLTNSNPDDVSEFLAKHGAGGKKAAEQELAKVVKAIEELDNEQADTEGLTGVDALLAADEQATEKNARKTELERQQAFWKDQINRIDKREEAVRKEEERKAAEKLKAEQKKQRSLAAFNKPINDARKRMADDPDAMDILDENNREPRTLEEAVADLIPQKGLVLKNWTDGSGVERLGLEGELGMNSSDLKKLTPFIGTVENGATDITTLSERIYENLPESIKNLAPDGNRDVRDAIIKILSEAQTADDIIHFVDNARIREAEAIYSANAAAAEEYERAKAEHTKQVEDETAPTYTAAEDPFAGSTGDAPFSFTGIKTPEDVNRHNERARKQGGLILNEESIKLERRTANLLDTIGRQLGRTIEVDPSLMQLGANGQASADGKTLFLSPKVVARGDQMVRFITGHELTHLIKKGDKDIQGVWNDFKKTVQDAMGDEFARIYDEKAKLYKDRIAEIREQSRKTLEDPNASEEAKAEARKYANLRNLSKEQIEEEVICDFIGDKVLTDEEFVKNMIERVEASNADSASICQRMRNFIDKILTYLKSLKNPSSSERKAQEALERAKDIWSDMYELAAAKQREKLDMDLKMKTTSGNTVEIENDGTAKFSLETENDPENKRLIQAIANTYHAKWAKEDMQKVLDDTDKVMQDVLPLLDIHPDFNMTQQRTVALNSKGEPIYNVIFQNHDTEAPTIEFSTNCVKKESMNMLLDALRNAGQLGKLNEINLDIVLEVLKKHGYNIPCKMCYIESKRNILHLKEELANKWNSIAEAIKLDKNANILDDINVDLDENRKAKLNEIIKKRGSATIEGRIAKMMLDYPELRGRLRYEDIITPDGYEAILGKFSETPIMSLLSGYAGAASAKPTFGTHPFDQKMFNAKYNMMLPYFGENGMKYGGFRSRSFSDADPNLFVDEVQIRRNLVLTKSGMFGYTKVPYEVDMFGETGEFINMSLVVDVNGEGRAEGEGVKAHQANADLKRYAGLIKVGDPRHQQGLGMTDAEYEAYKAECGLKDGDMDYYFSQESFPVKKAIDFRKEERFGGRVGTVVVGVSDEMIRKALADDRIDMVIPYHRSSKTVVSAEATNYYLATDYSAVQETKGNKGRKTSDSYLPSLQIYAPTYLNGNGEVDFNFNEACQTLGNAKVAAEAYKEWCSVNRFTPKFSDFKDDPNYYKLLIDFRRFDNEGNPLVQGALQMKLPNDWATRLDGYLTEREQTMAGNNEMLNNKALMKDVYKVLGIKKSFALPEKEEQMPIWGTSAKNAARASEDKGINNSVDDKEFLHNSIKDGKNSPELLSRSSKADLNESTTPATNEEEAREEAQTDSFSFVEDPELLDKLNKEKTVPVYRAMQLIDGKLYPPMAAAVDGKMVNPIELGRWEQSDERPDLAVPDIDPKTGKQKTYKDGTPAYKFKLDKGTKDDSGEAQSTIPAGYNPYIHTSRSPLNDQFSSAWKRGHLVTVKVEVPESELTSGYRAEKSKDAVGEVEWKSGGVSGKLAKIGNPRRVILSRYDRPVEIVPTEEVAKSIAKMLEGTDIEIPFNVVNAELREALVKEGVKIGEPEKGSAGKAAIPAYEEWKAGQNNGMVSEPRMDVETEKILSPVTEVDAPSNIELNNGILSAEGNARMELYSNMDLADAREDIRSVAKYFNGRIGNASAGAFNYEKEGSEDTIHSIADENKSREIGRAMTMVLEDYKDRLQEVGAKYEGVRKKVFDDAIADVDKAIKWYTEFANGEHQKIGEHADDGIKFSFTIPQNEEEYKKKETAWHTVMKETVAARHAQAPDQSENAKPLSAAKVQKIENITKSLEGIISSVNKKSIERNDFLNWISGAIGFRNGEKDKSKYGTAITLGNGDEVYMRVSNHSGRMINFELYRQNDKDSYGIVVNSSVDELDGYRPRFKDKKNVDHLELQYYTERFDDATENQRQTLELGIAEGIKHLISTGSFEKMPLPNDVNPSGIYKRIFNEVKKRIEQENEINFSFEDLEQDKTLAGVHNLTMDKLRKAMRLGGLANPSVAVVDREKHAHDEFGDVSLILPSNLIDSRTGRNAGTWTHDVWTPTYPKSRTVFTSEGRKSFVNMLDNSGIDEGIRGKLMDEIDQMQFSSQPNLAYLYLKSRGIDATEYKHPDLTSDWVDIFRKHKTADKLLEAMKADENLTKKVNGATQHYFEVKFATEHRDQYIVAERNGEPGALIKAIRANRENMRKTYGVVDGKFSDEQVKEAFDAYKKKFRSKKHGVDDYWSVQNAYYDVYNRGWFEDYENWLDKTLNEHGVKTELHAGVDRNGNSKYVPDTVQNASRIMNESQKQTGGGSFGGWGTFIAQMAKHMKTLSDIRERKSMLGNEDNNEDVKYVRENFSQFPTMLNEKNPDLDLWDGSASKAFADLLKHIGKVQEYAKRKYGIDLSEDEVEDIKEYYKAFKRMPIDYFETKFDRPVSLNEFVSAVVPKNAPSDIVEALENSGLQVFKYNPKKEGDREKVSRKAMSDDRVSFSFEEEQQKSPEFKAWFGDWENDPENASKVVDKEGKPLIVYHGAQHMEMYFKDGHPYTRNTEPFTVFKEGKGFFTDDKDAAKTFARGQKGLYACYLDIKKPFIFDCKGMDWDMLEGYDNSDNYKYVTTDYIVKDIKTNHPEYDGIIFKNVANENSGAIKHAIDDYIPLKPNQIKSATENNGEFSKENDDIRFSFLTEKTPEQFDELHKLATENTGYVPVGIEKREVKVVPLERHPFSGSGKQALDKARTWASKNIVGVHVANEGTPEEYRYNISEDAIDKFLSSSSTKHSYNLGLHLATLMKLPEIIENSIDAEIHPDYNKVSGNRSASNGVGNKDMLVHRLYGAAELEDTTYRVKNTVKEIRGGANDAYNYEITKVELPISGSAASDALGNSTFIMGAKLLENVEKSYEKGEKLLAASMKNAETAKLTSQSDEHTDDDTSFSFEIPAGKTKQQMQAETDADIARQMNTVREGDTLSDVVRKATAIRESDKLVKLHQTISDNLIKSGDSFEDVLRKAEALKTASAEVDSFAFSREERARRAYEREKKRQEKAINDAQKALRKKVVDEITMHLQDKHLEELNRSTLKRILKDVQNADANNIEEVLTSARTEVNKLTDKSQQRVINEMMNLKTKDLNGKGMSIAKNVSDSVRRTLDMIRGRITDLKALGYAEDMTQLRRMNFFINGENARLERHIDRLKHEEPTDERTQETIDKEIAETEAKIAENLKKKEANNERLKELKVEKEEVEAAKALSTDADVKAEIEALNEKMDKHITGEETWTLSDSEKLTGLQILEMKVETDNIRRDIALRQNELDDLEERLASYRREARQPQRYVPVQRMQQIEQQIAGTKAAIEQATKNLIAQNSLIIDTIKEMIQEGKDSLLNKVEARKNKKFELLHGMLGDIETGKRLPDQSKEKKQQKENFAKKLFTAQLHSFEYLAKRINENSLGEDGWFYNYFVKGENGVMQAENNYLNAIRETKAILDAKAKEIYGTTYMEAAENNNKVDNHPGIFLQKQQGDMIVEQELPLSKAQAMYLYMVWKMADGRMKLELHDFTEQTMSQIEEFIGEENKRFADWIQEDFLTDKRAKYNDLYVDLYNTSMANIENYIPLKIRETEYGKDTNMNNDKGKGNGSLKASDTALIERRFNTKEVSTTVSAFDVITEHVNNMEEWYAFAPVRRDLDDILSNTYVQNRLNANSAGRFEQLYDAARIAAHAYRPDPAKIMDDVVGILTKGVVGGNIAFRYTTAIKQVLSVPAFAGYSYDPKFLGHLAKNIGINYGWNTPAVFTNMVTMGLSGRANIKKADEGRIKYFLSKDLIWSLENLPSFRNRVLKRTAGIEMMDEKLKGTVGKWIDAYLDLGMGSNQMIDAITCSIGIKTIYDYKYDKLSKAIEKDKNLSPEEKAEKLEAARQKALMEADIYYNATQQSNHAAFLSPMQLSRSMIDRALSVYQNASIGYSRRAASAAEDLYKIGKDWKKLQNEYAARFMEDNPELDRQQAMKKANKYLMEKAGENAANTFLYGFLLNKIWDMGSLGIAGYGAWWFLNDDDEKKKKEQLEKAGIVPQEEPIYAKAFHAIQELSKYPFRGLTGVNMVSGLLNGNLKQPLLFWDEVEDASKTITNYWEDDDMYGVASYALYKGMRVAGFDERVWENIVLGMWGFGESAVTGNANSDLMIDLMLALNTPNTNRRAVAEHLYKDMDRDTYVNNIIKASKYTDNKNLALLPGMKLLTAKNQLEIYKEFELNHLPEEEYKNLKSVQKEALKHLKSMEELQKAYDEEKDPAAKNAIGSQLIKVMKEEKEGTADALIKKARESLLVKDPSNSKSFNKVYIGYCTSNDLMEDEMLKELRAEYKTYADKQEEISLEGDKDAAKEYGEQYKKEIDKYENIKTISAAIAELKRDLIDSNSEESRQKIMQSIRNLRKQLLTGEK